MGAQGSTCGQFRRLQNIPPPQKKKTHTHTHLAVTFLKSVLAVLHARVSFYLHWKEDFTGMEKLFSVMNFHWITNIRTYISLQRTVTVLSEHNTCGPALWQTDSWDHAVVNHFCLFTTTPCKTCFEIIALVNLQSKIHLWVLHETAPQFVNSWTACSRNEPREDTHMRDVRWTWPHQEWLVSKTVLCRSQWLCCPRRLSEVAWFWDRGFTSSSGHGRSLLLFVVYYVGNGRADHSCKGVYV